MIRCFTDSHMDLQNEDSVEAMESMVAFVNKEHGNLDFVLFGGDNFNNLILSGHKHIDSVTKI